MDGFDHLHAFGADRLHEAGGLHLLHGLLPLLVLTALAVPLVWALRSGWFNRRPLHVPAGAGGNAVMGDERKHPDGEVMTFDQRGPVDDVPIAILKRRFAAGEITQAEYERMRRVLLGDTA